MSASAQAAVLSVSGIGKTYAQPVLGDIDLTLMRGEVLALTGENGAGKSTLSKIIGGLVTPTTGQMQFQGQPYEPASRTQAEKLGVRMVMQELNLLPTLSVAENLFLDNLPSRAGFINRKKLREDAVKAMAQVGLEAIDPDTPVGELGIGHQQMVEIARNLIGDCHVLILDEPTAMLTAREVEMLFEQITRLQDRGVSIIYISHRLEELARVAQRIAVLRDGKLVGQLRLEAGLHQLSIRHMAIDARGRVWFGCQFKGAPSHSPQLVGYASMDGVIELIALPAETLVDLRNYVGSVAASADGKTIAVSSPEGNLLVTIDVEARRPRLVETLRSGCGLAADGAGFVASSGLGALIGLDGAAREARDFDFQFDNHLLRVG